MLIRFPLSLIARQPAPVPSVAKHVCTLRVLVKDTPPLLSLRDSPLLQEILDPSTVDLNSVSNPSHSLFEFYINITIPLILMNPSHSPIPFNDPYYFSLISYAKFPDWGWKKIIFMQFRLGQFRAVKFI